MSYRKCGIEQVCKLYVGDLPSHITVPKLKEYFAKFGSVRKVHLHKGKPGKTSKFGYVEFNTETVADRVMEHRPHWMGNQEIKVKRCIPDPDYLLPGACLETTKLIVRGLPKNCQKSTLEEYFGRYGQLMKVELFTADPNNPRGLARITFDDYDIVDKLLIMKRHRIAKDIVCDVQKPIPAGGRADSLSLNGSNSSLVSLGKGNVPETNRNNAISNRNKRNTNERNSNTQRNKRNQPQQNSSFSSNGALSHAIPNLNIGRGQHRAQQQHGFNNYQNNITQPRIAAPMFDNKPNGPRQNKSRQRDRASQTTPLPSNAVLQLCLKFSQTNFDGPGPYATSGLMERVSMVK